jgi:dissimilatory sulfite reductase (desulfoviridin) alpha/beta subunit
MADTKFLASLIPADGTTVQDNRRITARETGYVLNVCRGTTWCEHSAAPGAVLVHKARQLLDGHNLGRFLAARLDGPVKAHHRFRVGVAACPNSCSQPQIMDVGFVGACVPSFTGEECLRCGACVEVCRDKAVRLPDEAAEPIIKFSECLTCGACARVCPSGCLAEGSTGWRVLLGGRLGRHPALAREIVGLHTDEEALAVLETCLDFFTAHYAPGRRFGEILEAADGYKQFGRNSRCEYGPRPPVAPPAPVCPAGACPTGVYVDEQVGLTH